MSNPTFKSESSAGFGLTQHVALRAHLIATGELKKLHRELDEEALAPAALQPVPLVGTGKLEIRIARAPKDPRIPSYLEWAWAVIEVYVQDGRIVHEETKRQGLKETFTEVCQEAGLVMQALQVERGTHG
jgi:hypothetical protein